MIFRAPEPDRAIPEVALTPFLLEGAHGRGDKPAFIDGPSGRTITYRGLSDAVRATAAGLAARGFRKDDVFAIYSPNLPEYAVAFHAVSLVGGIVTTINPAYTAGELSRQLEDAGARALVTVPGCLDKAAEAARDAGVRGAVRVRRGRGRDPLSLSARGWRRSAGGDVRSARATGRASLFQRDDRAAQGRDAHPPQPRREHRPVREHAGAGRPRHHARRAALLPHLRHGRHHEPRDLRRGDGRDDAAVRARGVPADRREVQDHVRERRSAARPRVCKEPDRRQVRSELSPHALLGRRAAGRKHGDRRVRASRLQGRPGIRPDGNVARHARDADWRGRRSRSEASGRLFRTPSRKSSTSPRERNSGPGNRARSACADRR